MRQWSHPSQFGDVRHTRQKILERNGIRSYVKRVTKNLQVSGCGYGLEIHGDVQVAAGLISNAGIRIIEVAE